MNIEDIRTENLKKLIQEHGTQRAFARITGKNESMLNQWIKNSISSTTKKPIYISGRTCREIEKILGLPDRWMDDIHEDNVIQDFSEEERINKFSTNPNCVPWYPRPEWDEVGNWQKPERWYNCDKEHSRDTYCITVRDMSLYSPTSKNTIISGDIVFIDPNATCTDGDFVFATSSHYKLASIKQLKIQDGDEWLFTPNPSWQKQWVPVDDKIEIHGKVIQTLRMMK